MWIEMPKGYRLYTEIASRPARALWIEIGMSQSMKEKINGRGPRGPCGLKSATCPWGTHIQNVEAREGLVD